MADTINMDPYKFLDQEGVVKLAKGILTTVNARIAERITLDVNATSDEMHVPSAAAVWRAINNSKHLKVKVVTGNINEQVPLANRYGDVVYWQRDNATDKTWRIFVWVEDNDENSDLQGSWINLGDTDINLEQYWSKSDADVESMKYVLGINAINAALATLATKDELADLSTSIDTRFTAVNTALDTKADKTDLDSKVDHDDIDSIPLTTVQEILDGAKFDTEVFYTTHVLTIRYFYPDGTTPIATAYTGNIRTGSTYTITSPAAPEGYYPTTATARGVMPDQDTTVDIVYDVVDDIDNPKKFMSITYVGPEGFTAPEVYKALVNVGEEYTVESPAVTGYTPDIPIVTGTVADENIIVTVTYTADVGQDGSEDNVDDEESDFNFE